MGRDEMRAADADRQLVADRLRGALDEGRLSLDEYDERLQSAYAAKTYGELNGLLADLPSTVPVGNSQLATAYAAPVAAPPVAGLPPDVTRRWLANHWEGYLAVVAVCVVVWVVGGAAGGFWPIWVIGPWGIILLVSTVTGLLGGAPRRWAAEQEQPRRTKGGGGHGCGSRERPATH